MINRVLKGVFIIIVVAVACVIMIRWGSMRFSQTANKSILLTKKYTVIEVEELKNAVEFGNMTFSNFQRDFNAQCVRRTHQGCYVVLLMEDNRRAFVFFDENDLLIRVMVSSGFISKVEFQNQVKEQMPKSEVLRFDANSIIAPISAVDITTHIVREGICIVKYSRFKDGKTLEDPIVTSIEFINNEGISTSEDLFIKYEIPLIFEVDKVSE